MTPRLSLLAAYLCCILLRAGADRDVPSKNYFARLRARRANRRNAPKFSIDEQVGTIRGVRPRRKSRASLLAQSFLLAAVLWTIKQFLPQMRRWVSRWCRDLAKFRRVLAARAKEMRRKQRREARREMGGGDESTVASSRVSITPSVREIIEIGNAGEDSGSSYKSAGASLRSLLPSLGSFGRRRRRASFASASSDEVAGPGRSTSTQTKEPTALQKDLPRYLNFVEKGKGRDADARPRRDEENQSDRDISHLWSTEPAGGRKNQTPLERKLASEEHRSSRQRHRWDRGH